jgi:hypothetical protein
MRRLRQRFWLAMMDVFKWAERHADRAYSHALTKASDATDWSDDRDEGDYDESEAAF